ncbi:MAG: class I SAM-dependent methyltransferase [Thermoplasmata archaeon]|nr:class I SAM-dependent methyltransferase [Thermoplasmata archaeon]
MPPDPGPPANGLSARRSHWEAIYRAKGEDELSWHQDHPALSFRLIAGTAARSARIVDVGGGSSTLASELIAAGFPRVMVLDISPAALGRSRARAPVGEGRVVYRVGDVTTLPSIGRFDVWHDRAVFHFLTTPAQRRRYVDLAARTLPVGGHAFLATFSPAGPDRCSGLPVRRYDSIGLAKEFEPWFILRASRAETHRTPWKTRQPFTYVVLERARASGGGRTVTAGTAEPDGPRTSKRTPPLGKKRQEP